MVIDLLAGEVLCRKVLGNVVISKKILRTRKTMVMHSNERVSSMYPRRP